MPLDSDEELRARLRSGTPLSVISATTGVSTTRLIALRDRGRESSAGMVANELARSNDSVGEILGSVMARNDRAALKGRMESLGCVLAEKLTVLADEAMTAAELAQVTAQAALLQEAYFGKGIQTAIQINQPKEGEEGDGGKRKLGIGKMRR